MNALRRVPPVVLALAATLALIGVVIGVFTLLGGDQGRPLQPCTAAQDAGPYGCVVLVSIDGTTGGQPASEPSNGAIALRIERTGGQDRMIRTGGCGGEAPIAVTRTAWRIGATTAQAACAGGQREVEAWAAALLTGTVQVVERDSTVELTNGDRTARFAEVIAPRS